MPTEIKAAVLYEPNTPLQIESLLLADPGPHEARIALQATGLCHSDLNCIAGSNHHYKPVVLGHEGFGVVQDVGSEVTTVAVGDTVIPYLVPDCGECELCRSGLTNNCVRFQRDHSEVGHSHLSLDGVPIAAFLGTATFAEQTVVHESQIVKVNPAADPSLACCLACGVTTGLGAALKTAAVQPGSSVAVLGVGGVGLSAVQGARLAGAATIIASDTNLSREPVARSLGATHFLSARSGSLVDDVRAITGRGVQYSFDCVGQPTVLTQALAILDRGLGGVAVSVGVLPAGAEITLTPGDLTGATLRRSFMGEAKRADVAQYVDRYVEGKLDLDRIVSHRIALDYINEGFRMMTAGDAVRVVVTFD
jgi:S-(hydroxymethyl)glutathione dehydrogenase / alcohol dehydrogenase